MVRRYPCDLFDKREVPVATRYLGAVPDRRRSAQGTGVYARAQGRAERPGAQGQGEGAEARTQGKDTATRAQGRGAGHRVWRPGRRIKTRVGPANGATASPIE
ncbi:hypothetical protein GCM10009557_68540 [Virgisporangium ochraceum]|uniref:Uncharacterized protein n=1 Tax=Virgisporangium ochraceum TaxID=65505 RepID=A0A8J4EIF6_9ACTN|nr:hypothetical protein Voc01_081290 [Virgisporangium ochraceum]